jgi:GT2 family glycosyltransferase
MQPGLSIIIVNYKSAHLITNCINSFVHTINFTGWEIIIVDNDSGDNVELLAKPLSRQLSFIQMGYNAGFARANNAGMQAAKYDTILLLNADTIIQENAIAASYALLQASPHVACGVQLLNADGTNQISGSRIMKGGLNYLLLLPYVGSTLGWLAKRAKVQKPSIEQASAEEEVDWINGAFLMVKRHTIQLAGGLDEDFFLYMEEIEWCSRLRKQGPLVLFGHLHVLHLQGETTKDYFKTKKKGYQNLFDKMGQQLMLSIWVRQRKEFGLAWFLFLLLAYGLEIPAFLLMLCLAKILRSNRYTFQDFKGYTRNYIRNLAYLKSLVTNKPCFYKVL